MAVVVEPFDRRHLDGAVHPFDLAVGPWVVGLSQPVHYAVGLADHVEAHQPGIDCVPTAGLLFELDSVIGQDRVDLIVHGFEHVLQELPGRHSVGCCDELHDGELGRPVNSDNEKELALGGLHLGNAM